MAEKDKNKTLAQSIFGATTGIAHMAVPTVPKVGAQSSAPKSSAPKSTAPKSTAPKAAGSNSPVRAAQPTVTPSQKYGAGALTSGGSKTGKSAGGSTAKGTGAAGGGKQQGGKAGNSPVISVKTASPPLAQKYGAGTLASLGGLQSPMQTSRAAGKSPIVSIRTVSAPITRSTGNKSAAVNRASSYLTGGAALSPRISTSAAAGQNPQNSNSIYYSGLKLKRNLEGLAAQATRALPDTRTDAQKKLDQYAALANNFRKTPQEQQEATQLQSELQRLGNYGLMTPEELFYAAQRIGIEQPDVEQLSLLAQGRVEQALLTPQERKIGQLNRNSLIWHGKDADKAGLQRENDAIRKELGLRFDAASGVTYDPQTMQNLSVPVQLATGAMEDGMTPAQKAQQTAREMERKLALDGVFRGAATQQDVNTLSQRMEEIGDGQLMAGVRSVGNNGVGSVVNLLETGLDAGYDLLHEPDDPKYSALKQEYDRLMHNLTSPFSTLSPKERQAAWARTEEIKPQLDAMRYTRVTDGVGAKMLDKGQWQRQGALQDLDGAARWWAETGLSMADNAAVLPTALINPTLPAAIMGAQAAGQKSYELSRQGVPAVSAFERGVAAGGIEGLTERYSVGALLNTVKSGGKSTIMNILKQFGIEASEEGASYALNYAADLAANDPNATFSFAEMLDAMARGGVSGLGFGTVGAGIGKASSYFSGKSGFDTQIKSPAGAEQKSVLYTAKENPLYAAQIDGVFDGTFHPRAEINMGDTPEILTAFGAPKLPLRMTQEAARKIAYPEGYMGGKHNLGIPALKRIMEPLRDPLAILKSKSDGLVVLTEWVDTYGNDVVIPVHLNKRGMVEISNKIPSAYGKRNLQALLGENEENVLYTRENKSINREAVGRLQLPAAVSDDTLINYSISRAVQNSNSEVHKNDMQALDGMQSTAELTQEAVRLDAELRRAKTMLPSPARDAVVSAAQTRMNEVSAQLTAAQARETQTVGHEAGTYPDGNKTTVDADSAVHVGRATTIYSPYEGKVPQNKRREAAAQPVKINADAVDAAQQAITASQQSGTFAKTVKAVLSAVFEKAGGQRKITLQNVTFDGKPYDVSINDNITRKLAGDHKMTPEKLAAFYQLDSIIQNAEFAGSGSYNKSKAKAENVIRYDYFEKPLQIAGQEYVMTFDVEVFRDTNNFRTYKVINKIDLTPIAASHRSKRGGLTTAESSLFNNSISDSAQNSNSEVHKNNMQALGGMPSATGLMQEAVRLDAELQRAKTMLPSPARDAVVSAAQTRMNDVSAQLAAAQARETQTAVHEVGAYPDDNKTTVDADSAVHVGRATTIYSPYEGKVPQNEMREAAAQPVKINADAVGAAQQAIMQAQKTTQFKSTLRQTMRAVFDALGGQRTVTMNHVTLDGKPYDVAINKKIAAKVVSDPNMTPEKLAAFYQLDSIIQNAEFAGSGSYNKSKAKAENVIRYDYFEKPLQIAGQEYVMTFDVEVFRDTNNLRTYKVINEIDLTPIAASRQSRTDGLTTAESSLFNNSISDSAQNSNGEVHKNDMQALGDMQNTAELTQEAVRLDAELRRAKTMLPSPARDAVESSLRAQMNEVSAQLAAAQVRETQTVGHEAGTYPDGNKATADADSAVHVGRATTIYSPYEGKVPQNEVREAAAQPVKINADAVDAAQQAITASQQSGTFVKTVKMVLGSIFEKMGGQRKVTLQNVTFEGQPYDISINQTLVGKLAGDHKMTPEKLAAFYQLDNIVQKAEFAGSGSYNKSKTKAENVIRYDYFEKPLQIAGQEYVMTFDVEVFRDTNNFRTYKVINKIDLTPIAASRRSKYGGLTTAESSLFNNSISDETQNSNGEMHKNDMQALDGMPSATELVQEAARLDAELRRAKSMLPSPARDALESSLRAQMDEVSAQLARMDAARLDSAVQPAYNGENEPLPAGYEDGREGQAHGQATALDRGTTHGSFDAVLAITGQQDPQYGSDRARQEESRSFYARAQAESRQFIQDEASACAFTRTPEAQWSSNARAVADILRRQGIPCEVFSGDMEVNRDGVTTHFPMQAGVFSNGTVYIDNAADMNPVEIAAHEGFHHLARKYGEQTKEYYVKYVDDNVDVLSEQATELIEKIISAYLPNGYNVSNMMHKRKIREELCAYLAGFDAVDAVDARLEYADVFYDYDAFLNGLRKLQALPKQMLLQQTTRLDAELRRAKLMLPSPVRDALESSLRAQMDEVGARLARMETTRTKDVAYNEEND